MRNKELTPYKVNDQYNHTGKILWGAVEIGAAIKKTPKQVYGIFERRHLKSIRKVGGTLEAHLDALMRELGAE